jgi:hypothetical protein
MIFYSWTAITAVTNDVVVAMGITSSRERAMLNAEEPLLDGRAFVAVIETVRRVQGVPGFGPCYVHAGVSWVGRRTLSGGVKWRRYWGGPGPASALGAGRIGP